MEPIVLGAGAALLVYLATRGEDKALDAGGLAKKGATRPEDLTEAELEHVTVNEDGSASANKDGTIGTSTGKTTVVEPGFAMEQCDSSGRCETVCSDANGNEISCIEYERRLAEAAEAGAEIVY